MEKEESEFGKGLVTCLVKFAGHFDKYIIMKEKYRILKMDEKEVGWMWFNGASDHLYEIEVPKGKDWDKIRKKINYLKSEGLSWGHGNKGFNKSLEENDKKFNELMDLTFEIAVDIDKKLGLNAEIGEW